MALPAPGDRRGLFLVQAILLVGLIGLTLSTYFSLIQHEVALGTLAIDRAQALYLAEAGLDAAIDALSQDWAAYRLPSRFPLREDVGATADRRAQRFGAYEVAVEVVDADTLRLTSVGRSRPQAAGFSCERILTAVIVRKIRPAFHRVGGPGLPELAVDYFDKDGLPDMVEFSGDLLPHAGAEASESTLSGGQGEGPTVGYHVVAGFTDVDMDGDMDLVLSDAPSRTEPRPGRFIEAIPLSPEQRAIRPRGMTTADVLGTGRRIPVVASGWLWMPDEALSGREDDADVFVNQPVHDGVLLVSWAEVVPGA